MIGQMSREVMKAASSMAPVVMPSLKQAAAIMPWCRQSNSAGSSAASASPEAAAAARRAFSAAASSGERGT